jgi:hypothetical protein
MKIVFAAILLFFFLASVVCAQKRTFLRLYDTSGNKFSKGYLFATTDSSLTLYQGDTKLQIPAVQIGYIKTRRSMAHRVLIVSLAIVSVAGAVVIVLIYAGLIHRMKMPCQKEPGCSENIR